MGMISSIVQEACYLDIRTSFAVLSNFQISEPYLHLGRSQQTDTFSSMTRQRFERSNEAIEELERLLNETLKNFKNVHNQIRRLRGRDRDMSNFTDEQRGNVADEASLSLEERRVSEASR